MTRKALSRRGFVGSTAAALATAGLGAEFCLESAATGGQLKKPNSRIKGVQIGVITYSFRAMPEQDAEALLRYCLQCEINAIELMGDPAEAFAGIPLNQYADRYRQIMQGGPTANASLTAPAGESQKGRVMAELASYQRQVAIWRAGVSMTKFEQLRKMFNEAGVHIYGFKPDTFGSANTEAEIDYGMRAAKALGATQVTVELPTDLGQSQRLGDAAMRHGLMVGYHEHLQARPDLWDAALAQSKANGINLDIGHFVAADNFDALGFVKKNHARITSMHLKDRMNKAHGQANVPWGTGDTPLAQVLRLMRDLQYRFPAAIEMEYDIPAGSDAVREVIKCLTFCRQSLG